MLSRSFLRESSVWLALTSEETATASPSEAAAALLSSPSPRRIASPSQAARASVVMKSGSQVPFRVRKKRMENQDRGRMRLNVFRSSKHIYAQVIDDDAGRTLASASTVDTALKSQLQKTSDCSAAQLVGKSLAERCKAKDIDVLYFDRISGAHTYKYHGRVKSLVDGVREGGVSI